MAHEVYLRYSEMKSAWVKPSLSPESSGQDGFLYHSLSGSKLVYFFKRSYG